MKRFKYIFLALAACIGLAGCSGNIDPEDMKVFISADKSTIYADGVDAVTFTVTYLGEDVSRSKETCISWEYQGRKTEMAAGVNSFSTSEAGEYTFTAEYKGITSTGSVTLSARQPESTQASGWFHKMLAMEFTSVWCTYCPLLAEALKTVERTYPERIATVAFHENSMGEDPMTLPLNDKIYNKVNTGEGLPLFALDFRKSSQHIVNEYAKIVSEIEAQLEKYKPDCGVAIKTAYDASARKLEVKASFKSDVAASYNYHIFLVEDSVEGSQAGYDGSAVYKHDNVLRAMASDNVNGSKLNEGNKFNPGTEYTVTKKFDIPASWNTSQMRVIVSILKSDSNSTYICDNSNECGLGSEVGYLYEKDYVPSLDLERRVCVMEFTGTWCSQCPEGATTLNYLVNKAYKDKAYALAFHNEDEYSIPQEQELYKLFKWGGYPAYVTDMRDCGLLNEGGCSTSIEKSLYDETTHCGASVQCTYNKTDGTVSVKAGVLSGKEGSYAVAVYVVEDKVIGKQLLGTGEMQQDYTHRHVVRKMLSSSVKGDELGKMAFGLEESKAYSFKVEEGWNIENLSVAVLAINESGKVNNMAICSAMDGKMDYGYKK